MRRCRSFRTGLADAAFAAPDAPLGEPLATHLAGCPACAAELAGMRRTLTAVSEGMPEPAAVAAVDAWPEVMSRLDAAAAPRNRRPALTMGYPLAAAAAVTLMILGTWIGYGIKPEADPALPSAGAQGPAAAAVEASDAAPSGAGHGGPRPSLGDAYVGYLERATPLLLALANRNGGHGGAEPVSFHADTGQAAAQRLALEAGDLRRRLEQGDQDREARLIESLEVVFLQVANLTPETYPDKLNLVQSTIAQRAVLFQLTVEEMRRASDRGRPFG